MNIKKCLEIYNKCAGTHYNSKHPEAKQIANEVRVCIEASSPKEAEEKLELLTWDYCQYDALDAWANEWQKSLTARGMIRKVRRESKPAV